MICAYCRHINLYLWLPNCLNRDSQYFNTFEVFCNPSTHACVISISHVLMINIFIFTFHDFTSTYSHGEISHTLAQSALATHNAFLHTHTSPTTYTTHTLTHFCTQPITRLRIMVYISHNEGASIEFGMYSLHIFRFSVGFVTFFNHGSLSYRVKSRKSHRDESLISWYISSETRGNPIARQHQQQHTHSIWIPSSY